MGKIHDGDFVVGLKVSQLRELMEDLLRDLSPNKTDEPEILDLKQVSKLTGYTEKTIYSMINRRLIPCVKPEHGGRRVLFIRSEIIDWLCAVKIQTNEQAFQEFRLGIGNGRRTGGKSTRKEYLPGFRDKQEYTEFLRRNLREAKAFLKLWQFIHSLLLIQANKNYETGRDY